MQLYSSIVGKLFDTSVVSWYSNICNATKQCLFNGKVLFICTNQHTKFILYIENFSITILLTLEFSHKLCILLLLHLYFLEKQSLGKNSFSTTQNQIIIQPATCQWIQKSIRIYSKKEKKWRKNTRNQAYIFLLKGIKFLEIILNEILVNISISLVNTQICRTTKIKLIFVFKNKKKFLQVLVHTNPELSKTSAITGIISCVLY